MRNILAVRVNFGGCVDIVQVSKCPPLLCCHLQEKGTNNVNVSVVSEVSPLHVPEDTLPHCHPIVLRTLPVLVLHVHIWFYHIDVYGRTV